MKVLKFGGSSLADAKCFHQVANIVQQASKANKISTVLSAPKGITNDLMHLISSLAESNNESYLDQQNIIESKLSAIINDAFALYPDLNQEKLHEEFKNLINKLKQLSQGAKLLNHCPETTMAQLLSTGEKFSVLLLAGYLQSMGHKTTKIHPEHFLTTDEQSIEPVADLKLSKERFKNNVQEIQDISIMPGFFGVKPNGDFTTLGRNGSDYSAAILAVCIDAEICEVWTDVDGVYNSDPNLVSDALLLDKMSYNEAMELSYFGAKILHPKTISPLLQHQIPCKIKNTNAPEAPGTLISADTGNELIKAVTNLPNVAMVTVSGREMRGMVDMASRVFSAISLADISVIMISQSSAEYTISFCVPGDESARTLQYLNKAFHLELTNGLLDPIDIRENLAIITLVGDRMQHQKGIAAKFFGALSQARVNIIAIAQDSSERSISAVVRAKRINDAVKICHQNLFIKKPSIDAVIIGCGTVGAELINQIHKQQQWLNKKNIVLNVVGIANSKQLLLNKDGLDLTNWRTELSNANNTFGQSTLKSFVDDAQLKNPVIVDCTSNESIAMQYDDFLNSAFHVVTANKKANTASFEYYSQLRKTAQIKQRRFLYDTNVGAGLPVIDNLQGLLKAGDELIKFEGILSGSLSYIFGEVDNGSSLSQATSKARERGFTEPNPAEDLSGLDVARKALVIARECDLALELSDIEVEAVVPEELASIENADEFMKQLDSYDHAFAQKVQTAKENNQVLRYVASIENNTVKVGIQAVDQKHPLYSVLNGENALALHTRYYQPLPYVIRGYGAGSEVTAAGLFGDILKTLTLDYES